MIDLTLFLQRHRVKLTRLVAIPYFLAILFTTPRTFDDSRHKISEILGYAFLVIATIGRIWCAIYIAGRKNREICRLGPYSLCRNPLYLFSFIGLLGITLGAQHILYAILITPAYLIYYAFVIRAEECQLRSEFGEVYEEYCRAVPRILPLWRAPVSEDFSPRDVHAVFRALLDAQVFMWLLILLEIFELAKESKIGPWFHILWSPPF